MAQFIYPPVTISTSGLATEATLQQVETNTSNTVTELQTLNTVDFATETTLSSIDSKVLTDTQLRASPVPVSGPLTDTQLRASAVPVSVASLPLPTGAATAANQATEISSLASIVTNTADTVSSVDAVNTTAGQIVSEIQTSNVSLASIDTSTQNIAQNTLDGNSTLLDIEAALSLSPVDQLDSILLDTSSTNIPASASSPLQVVASTAAQVRKVVSVEDIGEFIGVYTGPALSEVLHCILPLGGGEMQVNIPAGTRVSLRNMKNATITSGFIAVNFLG